MGNFIVYEAGETGPLAPNERGKHVSKKPLCPWIIPFVSRNDFLIQSV